MLKINYDKAFYYMVITFAFIIPLSRAGISLFVILLPLLWIIEGDFKVKYQQIVSNKLLISITVYLLFNIISVAWSSNINEALNVVRLNSYWLILFVIATKIRKEQIGTIITAFLTGMFISEVIAYGVFFEFWQFKNATVENLSPFMMHIDYSVFMAFTSILLLNRILSKNYTFKQKIILLFFFLTVTGNLFLSIGRTGQIAFIISIVVLMIIHYRFTIKSILMSLIILGTILTSVYNISDTFQKRIQSGIIDIKNISNGKLDGSIGTRVAFWIAYYDIFKENPILGVGIGDYKDEAKKIVAQNKYDYMSEYAKSFIKNSHPHNQYLLVAVQMGIIGLIVFMYMIYQIMILKIKEPEIKELSVLFVTIFFVSCFAEPLFFKQFTIVLFILFIGLFAIKEK